MNIKRIRIQNIGTIEDLELTFEKGKAYHLIAENNSGKSMICEAFRAIPMNIPDNRKYAIIKDDKPGFRVEMEDFDGFVITIERGIGCTYTVENKNTGYKKVYNNMKAKVPEEVQKLCNVYYDEVRDELFNIRGAESKTLFSDTSPPENYDLWQKAMRTEEVIKNLKRAIQLEAELKEYRDRYYGEKVIFTEKLKEVPDLSDIEENIKMYKRNLSIVKGNYVELKQLEELYSRLDEVKRFTLPEEFKEVAEGKYDSLNEEVLLLDSIVKSMDKLNKIKKNRDVISEIRDIAKKIDLVREEIRILDNRIKLIDNIVDLEKKLINVSKKVDSTRSLDNLFKQAQSEFDIYHACEKLYKDLSKVKEITKSREVVEDLKESSLLVGKAYKEFSYLDKLYDIVEEAREVKQKRQEFRARIEEMNKKRENFMKENKYCPTVANGESCPFIGNEGGVTN